MAARRNTRDADWHQERFRYLQQLVQEYWDTESVDAKRQVLANLGNFAYHPVNYEHLSKLEVDKLFIGLLSSSDENLLEFAIGGLVNLACFERTQRLMLQALNNIIACLSKTNAEIVVSALTALIFLLSTSDQHPYLCPSDLLDTVESLERSPDARIRNLAIIFRHDFLNSCQSMISLINSGLLNAGRVALATCQHRSVARIAPWEYHIRFSPKDGRKIPCKDVLDRFKRLNNGMWIRTLPGRQVKRYQRAEPWLTNSMQHYTCTPVETHICDRVMNNFWLRPKHYIDDIYAPYHVRHGLKAPRVNDSGEMIRERKKILLEDTVADKHFYDR